MNKRLALLREKMKKENIAACIVPSSDPFLSEYLSECYKLRQWLCGFTGSNGTLVVTHKKSGLWTDGRYYIQAEKELSGSETELFRASERDCKKIDDYLCENLCAEDVVGVWGELFSKNEIEEKKKKLKESKITIDTEFDPFSVWCDRPLPPKGKVFVVEEKYAGESVAQKLARLREKMKKENFTYYVTALTDGIMWLLNIRGSDISHTPVVLSYLLVGENEVTIYADTSKFSKDIMLHLQNSGVILKESEKIYQELKCLSQNSSLAADFKKTNYNLINSVSCKCEDRSDFLQELKGVKNSKEIENIKRAYIIENTALIKSFYEIYNASDIDECDVCDIIEKNRRKSDFYIESAFETIAAYGANAAMMHYCPQKGSCAKIEKKGMLLIDTGGQYILGTTDTTRTLIMGEIDYETAENYTLVLKGNIALAMCVFPEGTTGGNIDACARGPLWRKGIDYRCGTGHGVGFILCVHEGPQTISPKNNVELKEGMTVTDEPGVYSAGNYGIRIENHLCVTEKLKSEYGKFLCFEVLNFCPIGTKELVASVLSDEERLWLNNYNIKVRELYREFLSEEEFNWLIQYTAAI